jgi:hypothetical protein
VFEDVDSSFEGVYGEFGMRIGHDIHATLELGALLDELDGNMIYMI